MINFRRASAVAILLWAMYFEYASAHTVFYFPISVHHGAQYLALIAAGILLFWMAKYTLDHWIALGAVQLLVLSLCVIAHSILLSLFTPS